MKLVAAALLVAGFLLSTGTCGAQAPADAPSEELTNSVGMKLKLIPAGEFLMGSPVGEDSRDADEGPQHRVRISQPFHIGVHEVTQGQWTAVMQSRPWSEGENVMTGAEFPATYVTWDDAVEFCRRLTERERQAGRLAEGRAYQLPTEAQWEYACRAGTTTAWCFGDEPSGLAAYAWYNDNTIEEDEVYAHAVGGKRANAWGLFDMHGNVWEWCRDAYDPQAYVRPEPAVDPLGERGTGRVYRGGSWYFLGPLSRSANRNGHPPELKTFNLGFRVVLTEG